MQYWAIIAHLRLQDVIDILFLTAIAYYLCLWFWGTKAFKALIGLLVLGVVFTVARSWGLFLTTWVLQVFWQVLVILLIILFQAEIRQVLERVNPLRIIGLHAFYGKADWIRNLVAAASLLAKRRIGALVVIERNDRIEEWVTAGFPLNGESTPELLLSIFQKESPLHDGAMIIQKGKVAQVASYLPLSSAEGLPKEWGTRHRAALGLSERCDACVVVVSEERGEISLARGGQMIHVDDPEQLSQLISEAVTPPDLPEKTLGRRVCSLLVHRWPQKVGTLCLVTLLWLLLAGQQDFGVTLKVPLETKNLPPGIDIVEPLDPEVHVMVQGLRKDVSILSEGNVHGEIDLSAARVGTMTFAIKREQLGIPDDQIHIVNIDPPMLKFTFREKSIKEKPTNTNRR
jgi:diadenylate cyclase